MHNKIELKFPSISSNEALARVVAGAVALQLDPTIGELNDIKTAVSEAVTNAIVHGYGHEEGIVTMRVLIDGDEMMIEVEDRGRGIEDVEQARQPFYTTAADEERSGMGFTVMETFMDAVEVESTLGEGTLVRMVKRFGQPEEGDLPL